MHRIWKTGGRQISKLSSLPIVAEWKYKMFEKVMFLSCFSHSNSEEVMFPYMMVDSFMLSILLCWCIKVIILWQRSLLKVIPDIWWTESSMFSFNTVKKRMCCNNNYENIFRIEFWIFHYSKFIRQTNKW